MQRANLRVLVVDDDTNARTIVSTLLRKRGHVVEARESALGTARHVATFNPDVVLFDVSMPGLTGDGAVTALRRTRPELVTILVSALPAEELAVLRERCGAAGYVRKSEPSTLVDRIESIVARQAERV